VTHDASQPVQRDWTDADDRPQRVADTTVERVLAVMGEPPADLERTAPVVTRRGRRTGLVGRVHLEGGGTVRIDDVVPDDMPFGYHVLVDDDGTERRLVVSPGRCWVPPEQRWGWAVQLYAARAADGAGRDLVGGDAGLGRHGARYPPRRPSPPPAEGSHHAVAAGAW
jgi:4-alpha-glucanotransferase